MIFGFLKTFFSVSFRYLLCMKEIQRKLQARKIWCFMITYYQIISCLYYSQ